MTERTQDREDEGPEPEEEGDAQPPDYPLLFKAGNEPRRKGMVDRIVSLFREEDAEDEPPPPRAGTLPAPRGPRIVREEATDRPPGPVGQPPARKRPEVEIAGPPSDPSTGPRAAEPVPKTAPPPASQPSQGPPLPISARVEATSPPAKPQGSRTPPTDKEPATPEAAAEPPPLPIQRATIQMLPGRLQPMDRKVLRQEIRFLRPPHPDPTITLGWERIDPPEHVTIDHPSVKMKHARMQYRRGHWWIESLVAEDPVRLNGAALRPDEGARHLKDGDRVGLGDIEFLFLRP